MLMDLIKKYGLNDYVISFTYKKILNQELLFICYLQ